MEILDIRGKFAMCVSTEFNTVESMAIKARKTSGSKLKLIKNDPWLAPFAGAIEGRHHDAVAKEAELTSGCGSLTDFANAHRYFGLHRLDDGSWVFREWAPNAVEIVLVGDFSRWERRTEYALRPIGGGVWEGRFPADAMSHGQFYKCT